MEGLEALERAIWCGEIKWPFISVRVFGGEMGRLVRKGGILAHGTSVATEQVCNVEMSEGNHVQEAQDILRHSLDLPEDDWRHGND